MKNMIELPTEADYHKTALIDIKESHILAKKDDTISYKKCIINLRSIVDISEKSVVINVIDEEKYPEYLKEEAAREEQIKQEMAQRGMNQVSAASEEDAEFGGGPSFVRPSIGPAIFGTPYVHPPSKEVIVTGVLVLYFNGAQRFIVDDYEEFGSLYFNYLKLQKLDIQN